MTTDAAAHTLVPVTTASVHYKECTAAGCAYETTHEAHDFKIVRKDASTHWEVCQTTFCGVTQNVTGHAFELRTDDNNHWQICGITTCAFETTPVAHIYVTTYGALADGTLGHWDVCTNSTYCAMTTNAAAHTLAYATNAAYHWQHCTAAGCDYETTTAAHITSAWITVTPAQIGVVGYKHTICTGCGIELELATIPALKAPAGGGGGGASVAYYNVTIEKTENGTFKVSAKTSAEGETIKITATPSEGYQVGTVTVMDSNNKAVAVTKNADGTYTFKMPASDVKVDVDFAKELAFDQYVSDYADCKTDASCPMHGYHDVNLESWYHNGVHFCLDNDLMVGYGEGEFRPNSILSRSMITSMLWKLAGSPAAAGDVAFDDVEAGKWYEPSIRWAASMGIVSGYTNGDFGPNDALTREQMVTVLWNFAKKMGYDVSVGEETNILSYDDVAQVAEYAIPAFQWACGAGLVSGKPNADNTGFVLDPTGSGTRAQIATVMMNFIEYYK